MDYSSLDYSQIANSSQHVSPGVSICSLALSVLLLVSMWVLFKKAGRKGWEAIIPFYNIYTAFDILYGNGIKFLTLLIPIYNIYVCIKYCFDFAKVFGKSTGFGFGILFLPYVFMPILAFSSDSQYVGPIMK